MHKILISMAIASSLALAESNTSALDAIPETVEESSASSNSWKNQFALYGWAAIPSADITLDIPNSNEKVESDISDKIDGVFMGSYRGYNEQYSVMLDAIYLGLSDDSSKNLFVSRPNLPNVTLSAKTSLDAFLGAGYVGYNVVNSDSIRLDLIAGVRYASLDVGVVLGAKALGKYASLDISKKIDFLDAVIGVDGAYNINAEWYIPYHLDIGTGDSDMTLRASTGIGYKFDWIDLLLTYRHIKYDFKDELVMKDISFSGPLIGVVFRF